MSGNTLRSSSGYFNIYNDLLIVLYSRWAIFPGSGINFLILGGAALILQLISFLCNQFSFFEQRVRTSMKEKIPQLFISKIIFIF